MWASQPRQSRCSCQGSGISRALVYRLASRYRLRAQTSSLLPFRRGRAPRSRLLDPEVEALICTVVERIYLQPERPRISDLLRAVETECQQRGLKAPAFHTHQARLQELDQDHLVRRRFGTCPIEPIYFSQAHWSCFAFLNVN